MDPHLRLVNALIGLSVGAPPWPRVLGDLGYELYWVGPQFTLTTGRVMNPDLLLLRRDIDHALVIEAKSGTSLKQRQLTAAAEMTVSDLWQGASLVFGSRDRASFTYVLACLSPGAVEVSGQLDAGKLPFPVVSFAPQSVRIERGRVGDNELQTILESGVDLGNDLYPTQFIPFDNNSSLAEVAASLLVQIIQVIANREPHFEVQDLLEVCVPIWKRLHVNEKRQLIAASLRVIDRLRKTTDFRYVITPDPSPRTPHLYLVSLRIPRSDGGERVVRVETLRGWADEFLKSLGDQGLPPRRPIADEGTQRAVHWGESA